MTPDQTLSSSDANLSDEDLIKVALRQFDHASEAVREHRQLARQDLAFLAGDQIPSNSQDPYALKVNLLTPFVNQVIAEAQQKNAAIKVVCNGDGADEEVAEVRGGIIRDIEDKSDARTAYNTGLFYSTSAGEGYLTLCGEYISEDGFDQELRIKGVSNPEMIFLDPSHEDLTGEDAEWGFIIKDVPTSSFRRQYPKSKLEEMLQGRGFNRLSLPNAWCNENTIRVAEYWRKVLTPTKLYLCSPLLDPTAADVTLSEKPDPLEYTIKKERKSFKTTIVAHTLTAFQVLDTMQWPGSRIPIFKVTGESFYVGGQRIIRGAIRSMIDAQRQYNFAVSKQMEMLDQAPKNSWVMTKKQLGDGVDAQNWANSNVLNFAVLTYNADSAAPPPSRVQGLNMESFSALAGTKDQSYQALQYVTGLNPSNFGQNPQDLSGVAQQGQVEQGSRSTFIYIDHFFTTLRALGREINHLLPSFYDTDRAQRVLKANDEEQVLQINSSSNDNRYDLSKGSYAVSISTGPAFASKREEGFNALMQILNALPESLRPSVADLVASQVESPISDKVAARFKAQLPPAVLAATETGDTDLAPRAQVQALKGQLAQAMSQVEQQGMKLQEAELENKQLKDQAALELTKADMTHTEKMAQLKLDDMVAETEAILTKMKLQLEHEKLQLARDELALKANMAMHEVNEASKPEKESSLDDLDVSLSGIGSPSTTDIGGAL
jgi:hypothetical protein